MVTGLPDGLTFDPTSQTINGTPAGDAKSGTATVTTTDGFGVTATSTIAFKVNPPVPDFPEVALSGGHVVPGTLMPSRAEFAWTATPQFPQFAPAKYRVVINGPGFNNRQNTITKTTASYSGLHGGHTYTLSITALDANGKALSETGHITIVTPH